MDDGRVCPSIVVGSDTERPTSFVTLGHGLQDDDVVSHPFFGTDAALRALADLCVYVEAPADVRLARRVMRDSVDRGRSISSVLDRYLQMVRPSHEQFVGPSAAHADLVLNGEAPVDVSVQQLTAAIAAG